MQQRNESCPPPLTRSVLQEVFFRVSFTSRFLLPSGRECGEAPAYLTTCLWFCWWGKPVERWRGFVASWGKKCKNLQLGFPEKRLSRPAAGLAIYLPPLYLEKKVLPVENCKRPEDVQLQSCEPAVTRTNPDLRLSTDWQDRVFA